MLGERDGEWQKATGVMRIVLHSRICVWNYCYCHHGCNSSFPANGKENQNDRWYETKSSC